MNRIMFACGLVLFIVVVSFGQTTDQSTLLCNLPREKAPVIRGVKLGMTADELFALIPGIRADYKDVLAHARNSSDFGWAVLRAIPRDKDATQRFSGIDGFGFGFFDDRLVQYSVSYSGPNSNPRGPSWPHYDDLISRFADAYHLPGPADWIGDDQIRLLKCKGFELRIDTSNSGAQISITEPGRPWEAEQRKRREAYEEQFRRDFKP